MRRDRVRIFFDGGCRPNPGAIEVAAVVRGVSHVRSGIAHGSNSDAEWLALLHAVAIARSLGLDDVEFVGDSQLVVQQASGTAKCRGEGLKAHLAMYHEAAAAIGRVRLRHVPRSRNLAGIALARRHG